VPEHPAALLLLGVARRNSGELASAVEVLSALARAHPQWPLAHYEQALALSLTDQHLQAIEALRPRHPAAPADGGSLACSRR